MKGYLNGFAVENAVFTVTVQGCTLRCVYCDRPNCWERADARLQMTAKELFDAMKESGAGSVLVTGGEPLEQAEFLAAFFTLCKQAGFTTCLDTPGSRVNPDVEALLAVTDSVKLHVKTNTEEGYRRFTGGSLVWATMFLDLLEEKKIPTAVRQLLVPGMNDTPDNARFMRELPRKYSCITECVFQPFLKGSAPTLYADLGLAYPMTAYRDAEKADLDQMKFY